MDCRKDKVGRSRHRATRGRTCNRSLHDVAVESAEVSGNGTNGSSNGHSTWALQREPDGVSGPELEAGKGDGSNRKSICK